MLASGSLHLGVTLLVAGGLIACSPAAKAPPAAMSNAAPQAPSAVVTIDMQDDLFAPRQVTIPLDSPVTFELHNSGVNFHNLRILGLGAPHADPVSATIAGGQTGTMVVTIRTAGTFKFQCDFHLATMLGEVTAR